jgi:hypothetical protein
MGARFCDIISVFGVVLLIIYAFVMDVVCRSSIDKDDIAESVLDRNVLVCVDIALVSAVGVNAVDMVRFVGVTVVRFCLAFVLIVFTFVAAVWAVACFFVERVLDRFCVVASDFDPRVVAIFVVNCDAVDCIDVATGASVVEFRSIGTASAVVVFVVTTEVGFVNVDVGSAAVGKLIVGLGAIGDGAAVVMFDLAVTVDNILVDIMVGAIIRICLKENSLCGR